MRYKLIRVLILMLTVATVGTCFTSCRKKSVVDGLSFCYWDTNWKNDSSLLRKYMPQHFYIRYFDVDWDDQTESARPIASVSGNDSVPCSFTPSVFISNNVLIHSQNTDLDSLAARIKRRVQQINYSFVLNIAYRRNNISNAKIDSVKNVINVELNSNIRQILIDCDWTVSTKNKYFYLIKQLKQQFSDKQIEVTLRLWQYNRSDLAGIPPVDRCLLMCYNMEMANDYNAINSIVSIATLKKYLSSKTYPIKLDIALPVFNWAVLFRNEKAVGLVGNDMTDDPENNIIEFRKIKENSYVLLTDKVIGSFFARPGDVLRIEKVSPELLNQMTTLIRKDLKIDDDRRVTFFSWKAAYLKNFTADELRKARNSFN